MSHRPYLHALLLTTLALPMLGCEGAVYDKDEQLDERKPAGEFYRVKNKDRESVFGNEGLFGNSSKERQTGATGGGISVNTYLWRATLDTIAFMPVSSADPFGGVVITDWYAPPESPNERFKLNIYVLDRALRADGLRVSMFRQERGQDGGWHDAAVEPTAGRQMEDAILTRARQLRNETRMKQE